MPGHGARGVMTPTPAVGDALAVHSTPSGQANRIKTGVITGEPVRCRRAKAGARPVRRKEPGFPEKMAQSSWTERLCPDHLPCRHPRITVWRRTPFGGQLRQPSFGTACAHAR